MVGSKPHGAQDALLITHPRTGQGELLSLPPHARPVDPYPSPPERRDNALHSTPGVSPQMGSLAPASRSPDSSFERAAPIWAPARCTSCRITNTNTNTDLFAEHIGCVEHPGARLRTTLPARCGVCDSARGDRRATVEKAGLMNRVCTSAFKPPGNVFRKHQKRVKV